MTTELSPKENEDCLSQNTARLLISIKDDSITSQVRELVRGENMQRRDSAVSLTSFDDEPINVNSEDSQSRVEFQLKRRRSSVQSVPQPKQKKVRKHKRKMRAMLEPPSLRIESDHPKAFTLVDWRLLLLEVLSGSETFRTKSFQFLNLKKVPKVVVAFVPGLYESDFELSEVHKTEYTHQLAENPKNSTLLFFYQNSRLLLSTTMLGSNEAIFPSTQAVVSFPVTKAEKKRRADELKRTKIVLYDLLVTKEQMAQNNYPLHSSVCESELPEGWVETKEFEHSGSHTFALDCEFCQSLNGPVLARVSMINFQGEVVYDTYVKPKECIINYVTRYSGITEELLRDVTTTAKDVQEKLLEIVSSGDILIGHSIESDLNVMKIRHPNVIDTSLIYDHPKGPPLKPGLKWLSKQFLAREIQQGEITGEGHSSVEDLQACLDLVKMKFIEGPGFGKAMRETTLFEKIFEKNPEKRSVIIDFFPDTYGRDLGERANVEKLPVVSDDQVVEKVHEELGKSDLLMIRFKEIDFNLGLTSVPSRFLGKLQCELSENRTTTKLQGETRTEFLLRLNERLQRIHDSLPENSMFLVCNEGGDLTEVSRLQEIRRKFQQLEKKHVNVSNLPPGECWDFDKQSALKKAVKEARNGISFVSFKPAAGESDSTE